MLKSTLKGLCALAAAAAFMASSAQAEERSVLIMEGGFFPAVSYVQPGDSITFTNTSDGALILASSDSSWVSDSINMEEAFVLQIGGATPQKFVAVSQLSAVAGDEGEEDVEYINLDDVLMEGAISFNPAPLDDSNG